jgi:hypothetical protein
MNFVHALIGVLGGNIIYYLLLPYLPPAARHDPLHFDLGMVVDFLICLAVFVLVKTVASHRRTAFKP